MHKADKSLSCAVLQGEMQTLAGLEQRACTVARHLLRISALLTNRVIACHTSTSQLPLVHREPAVEKC